MSQEVALSIQVPGLGGGVPNRKTEAKARILPITLIFGSLLDTK